MFPDFVRADAPLLESKRIRLRSVHAGDYDFLYSLAVNPAIGFQWRFRGTTPSPQQFVQELYLGVLCQHLVERADGERVGLVVAYQADLSNGTTYIGFVSSPQHMESGLMIEATAIFLS